MNFIIKKIKEEYKVITIILIFGILILLIAKNSILCSDDFTYTNLLKDGLGPFFKTMLGIYLTVNGRIISHTLIGLISVNGPMLWKMLITVVVTVSPIVFFKTLELNQKTKRKCVFILIASLLILIIDKLILRESVFWLTGSFNYFIPLVLIYMNYILFKESEKCKNIVLKILLFAFCLITTAMVEQPGVIVISMSFFYLVNKIFIKKEKICKLQIILFIANVIGFLLVTFPPSNLQRLNGAKTGVGIIQTTINMFKINYQTTAMIIFVLLFIIATIILIAKYDKSKTRKGIIISVLGLNLISYIILSIIYGLKDFVYFEPLTVGITDNLFTTILYIINILVFFASHIYISVIIWKQTKSVEIFSVIFAGILTQVMLIVTNAYGYRTLIPMVVSYIIYIAYAISIINKKYIAIPIITIITLIAIYNYSDNLKKYIENYEINLYNTVMIENCKKDDSIETIRLKKLPNTNYKWMMPYESPAHMPVFKQFYNVNENTNVIFE